MARVDVTTVVVDALGTDPAMSAPTADGDVIDAGRVMLVVENVGTSSHTVTLQTPLQVGGLDVAQNTVDVPAGEIRCIGGLQDRIYGRSSSSPDAGRVYVDYDSPANFMRAVVSF